MSKIIVADTGPLIAFARIDRIDLLAKLFGAIIIPQAVADECLIEKHRPGAIVIQQAISEKVVQIYSNPPPTELADLTDILDIGEAAAIKLAFINKCPLIIDKKLGRAVATKLQIKIIGSAGILLLAKQKKVIPLIKPVLLKLKNESYYLADHLINEVLVRAGEGDSLS